MATDTLGVLLSGNYDRAALEAMRNKTIRRSDIPNNPQSQYSIKFNGKNNAHIFPATYYGELMKYLTGTMNNGSNGVNLVQADSYNNKYGSLARNDNEYGQLIKEAVNNKNVNGMTITNLADIFTDKKLNPLSGQPVARYMYTRFITRDANKRPIGVIITRSGVNDDKSYSTYNSLNPDNTQNINLSREFNSLLDSANKYAGVKNPRDAYIYSDGDLGYSSPKKVFNERLLYSIGSLLNRSGKWK